MENNNIDKSKLMDAIGALGKGAALKKAIAQKDYNSRHCRRQKQTSLKKL